jgi:hypothetical protein
MSTSDGEDTVPAPLPLSRSYTSMVVDAPDDTSTTRFSPPNEDTDNYLTFACRYQACKQTYKDDGATWDDIIVDDYEHFSQLMKFHVPLDSRTFAALACFLTRPDYAEATISKRLDQDSDTGFDNFVCGHKGRNGGKTWGEIRRKDYNYFLWSVGNCMGRSTRTFDSAFKKLKKTDQALVMASEKGSFKCPKRAKYDFRTKRHAL